VKKGGAIKRGARNPGKKVILSKKLPERGEKRKEEKTFKGPRRGREFNFKRKRRWPMSSQKRGGEW